MKSSVYPIRIQVNPVQGKNNERRLQNNSAINLKHSMRNEQKKKVIMQCIYNLYVKRIKMLVIIETEDKLQLMVLISMT